MITRLYIPLLFSLVFVYACSSLPKGDIAKLNSLSQISVRSSGTKLNIDTALTTIKFTGYGVGHNHTGTFKVADGFITATGKKLTGGELVISINSLQMEEKSSAIQNKLRSHLLSADFFEATKFPSATFIITNVQPYPSTNTSAILAHYYISGNLTLKDRTQNITFPARVQFNEASLTGKANFTINRNWWGMSYGNKKSLGNQFISKKVNIQLNLFAKL